jgi:hypothetical protein
VYLHGIRFGKVHVKYERSAIPWPMAMWTTDLPAEAYAFRARLVRGQMGREEYMTGFGRVVRNYLEQLASRGKGG